MVKTLFLAHVLMKHSEECTSEIVLKHRLTTYKKEICMINEETTSIVSGILVLFVKNINLPENDNAFYGISL